MTKKLFVGNLPWTTNEDELRGVFEAYGPVESVRIITDRDTGRSRGFGFVEMEPEGADAAMSGLDGSDLGGRPLRVNEAKERAPRAPRY